MISALAIVVVVQQVASADAPQAAGGVTTADSLRMVRSARSAQSSFETFRRLRLPRSSGRSGPCDVTIGRYCYWRGDDTEDEPTPPEAPAIRERRQQLIRLLDSASRLLPRDAWLAGQRVRYLVESGERHRARDAAERECAATPSWCHALAGFALHAFGEYAAADSAYDRSLRAMTAPERCRWLDISDVIEGALADRYKRLDCERREALARRAMVLGAPLFSVGTTDLLTEYLARLTRAHIADRAATPDGESWGDDARELVIRYGWPSWYSRSEPTYGSSARPTITGHDAGRPYYFLPPLKTLEHPGETRASDWQLDDPRAPMGYAPAYAKRVRDVPHQIARFWHGDSLIAVAAWDATRDTAVARRDLDVALVLTNDVRVPSPVVTKRRDSGGLLRVILADSGLISLELRDSASKHARRARLGFARESSQRVWLSDLLVFRPRDKSWRPVLDSTLAEHALGSNVVRGRDSVAVFWEAYGLRREPVHFTLAVEQIGVSWFRRAAETFRLADRTTGVRVQWQEVPDLEAGVAQRHVRIDLSRLRTGRYRMQLTVLVAGEPPATSTREIEIR
jgi:hypothetical protein